MIKKREQNSKLKNNKMFTENDMVLMQKMQMQHKGLQHLIQEFRESNADKLLGENQQLQDRLYQLELEDRTINDKGYMSMPTPDRKFLYCKYNR